LKPVVATFSKEFLLQHIASKHIMASQCANKAGNPCLKDLRFCDDTKRKYGKSNIDLNKSFVRKEIAQEKMHGNIYNKLVLYIFNLF